MQKPGIVANSPLGHQPNIANYLSVNLRRQQGYQAVSA